MCDGRGDDCAMYACRNQESILIVTAVGSSREPMSSTRDSGQTGNASGLDDQRFSRDRHDGPAISAPQLRRSTYGALPEIHASAR